MAARRRSPEEQRRNYGSDYQRQRTALLATNPLCALRLAGCTIHASTADHTPPLALHTHVPGSGCCTLRPSCAHCNSSSGGWRAARAKRLGLTAIARSVPPPSRVW